ncbi:MAG TPA: HEAT repeat domain-containing protein [Candidatus Acidoferrales bacterium]|nr:HEAT repeat domain-containing protein [Candidatus Acidoferrales bacterium]
MHLRRFEGACAQRLWSLNLVSKGAWLLAIALLALPAYSGPLAPQSKTAPPQSKAAAPAEKPDATAEIYRDSWRLLDAGSRSENLRKRTDVIAALSSMEGDKRAIRLLEVALDDKHAEIRRNAASALGNMNAREAIPHLRQATNDKDAGVSFAAAEALWRMGDENGATIFYAVVLGNRHVEKGFVSSNIYAAWQELHNPLALADIGIGEASSAFLGPFAEGITIARELAKDRSAPARALSVTLLGERPNHDTEKILIDTLDDKNIAVRAAVAKALGGFDDQALIPQLAPLLSEKGTPVIKPVDAVRFMAAAAIIRLHNHERPDVLAAPLSLPGASTIIPH